CMIVHIVLVAPRFPGNTRTFIGLCANGGARLALVRPIGLELDEKKVRRAGLDYREYAHLQVHDDWAMTKQALQAAGCEIITALTTKLSKPFYDYDFSGQTTQHLDSSASNSPSSHHVALVFGSETAGLPEDIRTDIGADNWL